MRRPPLLLQFLLVLIIASSSVLTEPPRFDVATPLRDVLVPADAAVGAVFYRLRASDRDFDYPMEFQVLGGGAGGVVGIQGLGCSRFNSICQANMILNKRLQSGRFYDFTVEATDNRGEATRLNCSIRATSATTPMEKIFPGAPSLLQVSESARRNTELGSILAKGSPQLQKKVLLELWGSPDFGLHQKQIGEIDAQGTILLLHGLDYETKTVHHLTVLANDPFTNRAEDTRNIAGWPLLIAVLDEQDTPPVFTLAPPTTSLSFGLKPGDMILKVHAEDGDRGNPRVIRYGVVPDGNPFAPFFEMNDETGELRLARPLSDILTISHVGQPILLTVIAEEVRSNPQEAPAQSTTVQLALIPPGVRSGIPTFGSIEYNTLLDENSPAGTVLDLPQATVETQPGDVVTLELQNNNGTFDISPTVVEGSTNFRITVHDPKLLDYEQRRSVECFIVAKEIGTGNYTAKAKLIVVLKDINDNPPKFTQDEFHGSVQEHASYGTNVLLVEATDVDTGIGAKIKYTKLSGNGSELFKLDPDSGLITVADSQKLDAETFPVVTLQVEAADELGKGLTASTTVVITLSDINDQIPIFEKQRYEFIVDQGGTSFTSRAFIKAIDKDTTPPNNEVHYEIINRPSNILINERTGELQITNSWTETELKIFRARAWDGGVPRLSSECEIRIYPSEGQSWKMLFIVPGKNPDRTKVEETLKALTGGRVSIDKIRPYTGYEPGAAYITSDKNGERSVVETTVTYSKDTVIDLQEINRIINGRIDENRIREKEIIRIKESSGGSLLWLLILFFILLIIAAIILIFCCLCKQCPLYSYVVYKKNKQSPVVEKIEKIKIIGSGQGRESKSVQVAEWFGRREAWSPEQVMVDTEAESLRRHEMERGSDRGGAKRNMQRQSQVQQEQPRDQFYIREGNTDILRLITRGGEQQIPVTLVADQTYMADTGKDILMRRFIDQQQSETARAQVLLPNAVNRLQTEHELLEASLRQQNALLRQIILDRERDLRLETQSLPAGTQTDHDAGTQTEPQYLRPPRRKVQSDNDQSDVSEDDEISIIKAKAKRRHGPKSNLKRKIKTPIQEEVELEIVENQYKVETEHRRPKFKHTKTSELRQKRASSEARSSQSRSSKSGLRKEVLREISASLDRSDDSGSHYHNKRRESRETFSDDSLEISPRSDKTTESNKLKYHSESDLRLISSQSVQNPSRSLSKTRTKSQSTTDLTKIVPSTKPFKTKKHRSSRYMEWYTKTQKDIPKRDTKQTSKETKATTKSVGSRLMMDTESSSRKKVERKKKVAGPEHPLLQHSEHRFEAQYPVVQNQPLRRPEEDADSGIALTRPPIVQKKSVFTIAYDDMHTNQLRTDSIMSP